MKHVPGPWKPGYNDKYAAWVETDAETSKRFSDFHSAINCVLSDCGLELPKSPQRNLFEEVTS